MSKLISKIVVPDSTSGTGYSLYNVKDSDAVHSSDVGVASGVASLDSSGKVPSSQLPSYVDDVIDGYYYDNKFYTTYTPGEQEEDPGTYSDEITAETGKIYVDIPTNQSYRWSGSAYIVISSPYVLPTASANTLGGVKVGSNLSIDQNGVLSAQQQDGKFVVIKDLSTAPTEFTLTYTENGTVKNFKQGDEVRVPDAETDNGYTFYKLYALTTESGVTTATWDKLGAGGAVVNIYETIYIDIIQTGGNSTDLIGASITVTANNSGATLFSTTWNGHLITVQIFGNVEYTVSVGSISGYVKSSNQSYISLSGTTRDITFRYVIPGFYIEATDHSLYTSSTWASSGKTANSIVYASNTCSFKISLELLGPSAFITGTDPLSLDDYLAPISNVASAKVDYDGYNNTEKIVNWVQDHPTLNFDSTSALYNCVNYTFPDGTSGSYLPSFGELWTLAQNKSTFLTYCSLVNLSIPDGYLWASTYEKITSNTYTTMYLLAWRNNTDCSNSEAGLSYTNVKFFCLQKY